MICGHFTGREGDLLVLAIKTVAVNIDPREVVVESNRLQLIVCFFEGTLIPDSNIVDGHPVFRNVRRTQIVLHEEVLFLYFVQKIGSPGILDVVADVGAFHVQLVGFDQDLLNQRRDNEAPSNHGPQCHGQTNQEMPSPWSQYIGYDKDCQGTEDDHQNSVYQKLNVNVRIGGTKGRSLSRVHELIGLEPIPPDHEDDDNDPQHGQMLTHKRIDSQFRRRLAFGCAMRDRPDL